MKKLIAIIIFQILLWPSQGQNFINVDLEGTVQSSSAPPGWEMVPFDDPHCLSLEYVSATTDILGINGPVISSGLNGNPYSGSTFISGLVSQDDHFIWHEGIMQEVSGFSWDSIYTITFFQSVVKQENATDPSGAWAVYLDDNLIGISDTSYDTSSWEEYNLQWEKRTISFIPTRSVHLLKFLPVDNDNNISLSEHAGVRMGIDHISISSKPICPHVLPQIDLGNDFDLCRYDTVLIQASGNFDSLIWSTGSTEIVERIHQPGIYSVKVFKDDCYNFDTIIVKEKYCPYELVMPNLISPNRDNKNDIFFPIKQDKIIIQNVKIFNRWGQQIFEHHNFDNPWRIDELTSDGVYYWEIIAKTFYDEKISLKGYLNVLR